jgi:hypothetical protein
VKIVLIPSPRGRPLEKNVNSGSDHIAKLELLDNLRQKKRKKKGLTDNPKGLIR